MIRTHRRYALLSTAMLVVSPSLFAQASSSKAADTSAAKPAQVSAPSKVCPDCLDRRRDTDAQATRTFYLKYDTSQADTNEIGVALRTLIPQEQIIVLSGESAIVVRAIPEDMALAERIINDLDRAKKTWRLTYTVSEMDGTNRIGAQHYSMVVDAGQQAILKQGNKVPIATASYAAKDASSHETAVSYQDVGMTFDATLTEIQGGARLRSEVAQTSLADDKAASVTQDPLFRQATLRSEALLTSGKPLILGSMDIPGSTRHLQIEVLMEPLP